MVFIRGALTIVVVICFLTVLSGFPLTGSMDLLSPCPFWPLADGLPANYPVLDRSQKCDVLVLGAGITGALVAWHLAESGLETVVLDRRDVAHGSTSGSTSLLQYEIDTPLWRLQQGMIPADAVACYQRSLEALRGIGSLVGRLKLNCGFERKASLFLAHAPAAVGELRREFEARRAAGLEVAWWGRSELRAHSTLPHAAGILSADGGQIDVYRFTYGLLAAACARGCRVFDRSAVHSLHWTRFGVRAECAGRHSIRARHVVFATGYEADALLAPRLTQLHSTFAAISEPTKSFPGWPAGQCLIWDNGRPYTYLRTTADGRVIIGGADEPFRDPASRDRLVAAKAALLVQRFRRYFPEIVFQPSCAWAGTFAETTDGLPYIGRHPRFPRCWFALGYGGNGITYSLIAAESIRDGVLGRPNADEARFGFTRLSPPPKAPRRARKSLRLSV